MKTTINYPFGMVEINSRIRSKRVFSSEIKTGFCSRGILGLCRGTDAVKVIPFIERIEQSAHIHYAVCFCMAIEEAAELQTSSYISNIRTILLEKERIYSHFVYLNRMFKLADNHVLTNITEIAINKMIDELEETSGHRTYSTLNRPGGLNQPFSIGNLNYSLTANDELEQHIIQIKELIEKSRTIHSMYYEVAEIKSERHGSTGPFSWHTKHGFDLRMTKPYLAYSYSEIKEILATKNIIRAIDAYDRINAIIEDILCSCKMISFLLKDAIRSAPFQTNGPDQLNIRKGEYSREIETPRGLLEMTIDIDDSNTIKAIKIKTPSETNRKMALGSMEHTAEEQVQGAFESLYISAMEIDK